MTYPLSAFTNLLPSTSLFPKKMSLIVDLLKWVDRHLNLTTCKILSLCFTKYFRLNLLIFGVRIFVILLLTTEAVIQKCSVKKQAWCLRPATLLKIRLCHSFFLWILRNFWEHFFHRTLLVAASIVSNKMATIRTPKMRKFYRKYFVKHNDRIWHFVKVAREQVGKCRKRISHGKST